MQFIYVPNVKKVKTRICINILSLKLKKKKKIKSSVYSWGYFMHFWPNFSCFRAKPRVFTEIYLICQIVKVKSTALIRICCPPRCVCMYVYSVDVCEWRSFFATDIRKIVIARFYARIIRCLKFIFMRLNSRENFVNSILWWNYEFNQFVFCSYFQYNDLWESQELTRPEKKVFFQSVKFYSNLICDLFKLL